MTNITTTTLKAQQTQSWLLTHRNPLHSSESFRVSCQNNYIYDRNVFNKGLNIYGDLVKELAQAGMTEDDIKLAFPNRKVDELDTYEILAIML